MSPMSTTLDWIIACERQALLTPADVRRFRQLAEITGDDFSSRVVLKWLTTRDRITAEQAEQILSGPPDLTPTDLIIRVLGDAAEESSPLDLDAPSRELDESEEDTKDLAPLDRESVGDLVLPPRGAPAFAGTVTATKPSTSSQPVKALEPKLEELRPETRSYSSAFDELLADAGSESTKLPSLKSRPVEVLPRVFASPMVLAAAAATALVAIIAVYVLWRASR